MNEKSLVKIVSFSIATFASQITLANPNCGGEPPRSEEDREKAKIVKEEIVNCPKNKCWPKD